MTKQKQVYSRLPNFTELGKAVKASNKKYEKLLDDYNKLIDDSNKDIDDYNELIDDYNELLDSSIPID